MEEWRSNMLESDADIGALLADVRRVAVLGIKGEDRAGQPAHYVPAYLVRAGLEVVPVPVYYPDATEMLGARVYQRLQDVPGRIDLVDVFRRPGDIPPHLDDILAAAPRAVWFQSGIRHEPAARRLAEAGIKVVQDRCLMIEHRRHAG